MKNSNAEKPRVIATCDQEEWVKQQVALAIRMSLALQHIVTVGAEKPAFACALEGIVNGCAHEIIKSLGMEPEYVNIKPPPNMDGETLESVRFQEFIERSRK